MTGFARVDGDAETTAEDGATESWSWSWELRSVNSKGLDIRCRLPSLAEGWEAEVKSRIQATVARGSITANWTFKREDEDGGAAELRINKAFLRQILTLQAELEQDGLVMPAAPRLDEVLQIRGVVELTERAPDQNLMAKLKTSVMADLDRAIGDLVTARRAEGVRILAALLVHLDEIGGLLEQAKGCAEMQPGALRARMTEQVQALMEAGASGSGSGAGGGGSAGQGAAGNGGRAGAGIAEERLAQELALLATKADVREETDRLAAHIAQCRDLLNDGGAVGRKLDFLCQELNREANTVCSKAVTLDLTNIGVELKTRIERFREQIQNIE
jgi:uncharacterized protein (TIGR00255 family)